MAIVYKITNLINGHAYIGVTRFTSSHRWSQHKTTAKMGKKNLYLYRAIRKYGVENFTISDVASCLSHPAEVEKDVIQSFMPEYNMTAGGEVTLGRRFSEDTKDRISKSNTGLKRSAESKENISLGKKALLAANPELQASYTKRMKEAWKFVDQSKRHAALIKAGAEGRMNRVISPERIKEQLARLQSKESRAKMSETKKKKVECIETEKVFSSVSEAAEMLKISISAISMACLGKRKTAHKLHFKFI